MNNLNTKPPYDKTLYVNVKLPPQVKRKLDEITAGEYSSYTKTGIIRMLVQRFLTALEENRSTISILTH
jgi:predicted transcriptional regulator